MKYVDLSFFDECEMAAASYRNGDVIMESQKKLSMIAEHTRTEPREWALDELPWLRFLLRAGHVEPIAKIQINESVTRQRRTFLEWFLSQCLSDPAQNDATPDLELSAFSHLFRRRQIYSRYPGEAPYLSYVKTDNVGAELLKCAVVSKNLRSLPPILTAIATSAAFIAIHPFPDQNGRSGRILLTSALRTFSLWRQAPLPLSFLIYRDRSRYLSAQNDLFTTSNWDVYIRYMTSLITAAAELSAFLRYINYLSQNNEDRSRAY